MAYCLVACAQGLQYSNHAGALKDDDEQSADHGEACHADHQHKNYPDVEVEQVEPREYLRIAFLDGERGIHIALAVLLAVDVVDEFVGHQVKFREVLDRDFRARGHIIVISVQLLGGVEVREAEHFVEFLQVRQVDAGYREAPRADVVVAQEIGKDAVAGMQVQLVGHRLRDHYLLLALLAAEFGEHSLNQVIVDESGVVVFAHAL